MNATAPGTFGLAGSLRSRGCRQVLALAAVVAIVFQLAVAGFHVPPALQRAIAATARAGHDLCGLAQTDGHVGDRHDGHRHDSDDAVPHCPFCLLRDQAQAILPPALARLPRPSLGRADSGTDVAVWIRGIGVAPYRARGPPATV